MLVVVMRLPSVAANTACGARCPAPGPGLCARAQPEPQPPSFPSCLPPVGTCPCRGSYRLSGLLLPQTRFTRFPPSLLRSFSCSGWPCSGFNLPSPLLLAPLDSLHLLAPIWSSGICGACCVLSLLVFTLCRHGDIEWGPSWLCILVVCGFPVPHSPGLHGHSVCVAAIAPAPKSHPPALGGVPATIGMQPLILGRFCLRVCSSMGVLRTSAHFSQRVP